MAKKPPAAAEAPDWPAQNIERWTLDKLTPSTRNARTHTSAQVAQIVASIREWGWTSPILVDEEGTIIAGHGRFMAAKKLKLADVPVMIARGWTDDQKRAYLLADNKLALNAGWDEALLSVELSELKELGFELDLVGFSEKELVGLDVMEATGTTEGEGRSRMGKGLQYSLIVDCPDEGAQVDLLARLSGEGLKCRPLIS